MEDLQSYSYVKNAMKKTRSRENTGISIPPEIIFDILTRLPVKSLLRFRCVRKLWSSLLLDPAFADLYLNISLTRPGGTSLLISFYDMLSQKQHLFTASYEEGPATEQLTISNVDGGVFFSENINGLLCYINKFRLLSSRRIDEPVYMRNPSTRETITLPAKTRTRMDCLRPHHYSLGFDSSTNEYKVLSICFFWEHDDDGTNTQAVDCNIFTLGTFSWRSIGVLLPPYNQYLSGIFRGGSVCVNGSIHWRPSSKRVITTFDLKDESFRLLPLPSGCSNSNQAIRMWPHRHDLIQVGGCLAALDLGKIRSDNMIDMWILKDYKNEVWVKETILFPNNWWKLYYPLPVGSIHTGEILLTPDDFSKNVWVLYYDLNKKSFRRVDITGIDTAKLSGFQQRSLYVTNHVDNFSSLKRTQ